MTQRDLDKSALAAEKVVNGLKGYYKKVVIPLEKDYKFDQYFSSPMRDVDFEAKPLVLILGQYSVGKTTFIKNMIGRDFPGLRIGPEPTTDKFSCIYYGPTDQITPGNVLCNNPELPFQELSRFGANFLNKFEGSACASNTLKSFMFVDTPGVLSGKKQRTRQYPYDKVVEWFAMKAVRILLLFDCSKLDVSDEFKQVITTLRKHDEKIRVVLNKADSISEKELIRVYGALMWNLGKVFKTPEVLRVYISSFQDKPLNKDNYCYQLFKGDAADLIGELKSLPRQSAMQKVNDILKRMRLVKVHAQIMSQLAADMPLLFGKKQKQKEIIEELPKKFREIARAIGVPPSDFPSLDKFQENLATDDLSKYLTYAKNERKFKRLEKTMDKSIPALVKLLNDVSATTVSPEEANAANYNPFKTSSKENKTEANGALGDQKTIAPSVVAKPRKASDIDAWNDVLEPPKVLNGVAVNNFFPTSGGSVVQNQIDRPVSSVLAKFQQPKAANGRDMNLIKSTGVMARRFKVAGSGSVISGQPVESQGSDPDPLPGGNNSPQTLPTPQNLRISQPQKRATIPDVEELPSRVFEARMFPGQMKSSSPKQPMVKVHPAVAKLNQFEEDDEETIAPKTVLANRMPRRDSQTRQDWIVSLVDKTESDNVFFAQDRVNGKLTGSGAKTAFAFLKLPKKTLNKIWVLVDFNKTNELDADQFALAVWLGKNALNGIPVPEDLTYEMIPPSYREN